MISCVTPGADSTISKAFPGTSAAAAATGTVKRTVAMLADVTAMGKVMVRPWTWPQTVSSVPAVSSVRAMASPLSVAACSDDSPRTLGAGRD